MKPPVALLVYRRDAPRARCSIPSPSFRRSGRRCASRSSAASRRASWICRRTHQPGGSEATAPRAPTRGDGDRTTRRCRRRSRRRHRARRSDRHAGEAAGYTDRELWWEHQIEQRHDAVGPLRRPCSRRCARCATRTPTPARARTRSARRTCARRSARRRRRATTRIAVVCGAWHAPALAELGPAKPDAALLKGLPKAKIAATWIPWTAFAPVLPQRLRRRRRRRPAGTSTCGRRPISRPLRWAVARGAPAARARIWTRPPPA